MESVLRKWRMEDKYALAALLNDRAVLDDLRDGIPFPTPCATRKRSSPPCWPRTGRRRSRSPSSKTTWSSAALPCIAASTSIFAQRSWATISAAHSGGRGYATRAVRQACSRVFADTDILRIYAEPFARNAASCRVLEKAGFQLEGTLRKNAVKNGEVLDMKLYALVREEDTHAL